MINQYELVIRGGTIVDGSGAAPYTGDVAIAAGKIHEIGYIAGKGEAEIDAAGKLVKYSRGYRAGGISPNGADGHFTYGPEQVDAYEVGAKTSFHGAVSGMLDVAAFYNDFSNQQIHTGFFNSQGRVSPTDGIINAGSSRIYGLELDGSISPYKGLNFSVGYAYLNSYLSKVTPAAPVPGSIYDVTEPLDIQGGELAFTSRHKVTIAADYTLPLDPEIGKVTVGANYTYAARQLIAGTSPPQYQYIPATQFMNLNLSWTNIYGSPVDSEFFMTNVADGVATVYSADFISNGPGFVSRNIAPPRMFGGRVKYRF